MRRPFATALVLGLALAGCAAEKKAPPQADSATTRKTQSGEVVGFRGDYGSDAWYGIPYAKAPVGELRWRAPQPAEPWSGVRPALTHGASCIQYAGTMGGGAGRKPGEPAGSEDCLFLSIWAPRAVDGKPPHGLPVMVWIHGGGNTVGEAAFYDGGNLAVTEDVVVVAINYRLGPFGWFRHAALRGEGTTDLDRSGNYGTLDIVRSLEWVRDNVSAFGGDPGNVTVFGESAGGTNTFTMLLAPQARGLFHRAVVQSGGTNFDSIAAAENLTDATPPGKANSSEEVLLRFLVKDGKAKDRAGAKQAAEQMSPEQIAAYLRGKSAYEFLSAYQPMGGFGMIDMPKVFADGVVLPTAEPRQVFAGTDWNVVPVMLGTNKDENKLFMFGDPNQVRRILWIVPRLRDERMYNLTAEYMSKMWKASGVDEPAAAMRGVDAGVYAYRFDWDEEPTMLGADLSVMLGAAHAFEIPFVFGHFDLGSESSRIFTEENQAGRLELSEAMMSYWANFAYTGSPGQGRSGKLPAWTPAPSYMVLDTSAGGGLRMSTDTVTEEAVVAAVGVDPRLETPADRCAVLASLARWSRGFTREEYAARAECSPFPLAES